MGNRLQPLAWLLIIVLGGCHSKPGGVKAVTFGPAAIYRLSEGARELKPDRVSTDLYQARFNFHPSYNQPLYRFIKSPEAAVVYVGMVLPPVPANLATLAESDSVWQQRSFKPLAGGACMALLRNRQGEYDVRYLGKAAKSGNTHVVHLLTQDSTLARSYYDSPKPYKGNLLL